MIEPSNADPKPLAEFTGGNTHALAFEPTSLAELIHVADIMATSGMVPKDYVGKRGNIIVAGMAGRNLGFSLYESLQSFAVINGRATLWGDAVLALVKRASHVAEYVKERLASQDEFDEYVEALRTSSQMGDPTIAENASAAFWSMPNVTLTEDSVGVCEAKRFGDAPVLRTFSVADAKRAKLWNKDQTPWITYPQRMLQMRARSWALRDTFADILKGIAVREEAEDIPEEQNVTPAAPPEGTRGDQVRSRLGDLVEQAQNSGALEGQVEPPVPNFGIMVISQIAAAIGAEATRLEMPREVYSEIVQRVGKGRLARSTALAVFNEMRAWGNEREAKAAPPAEDTGAKIVMEQHLMCGVHERPVAICANDDCMRRAQEYELLRTGQPRLLPETDATP